MSLGWLSIGATGDINLTGLNVDTGTLYVDKTNIRVGIRTAAPSSVLQIDSAADNVYSLNPLTSNGASVFSTVKATPRVSPTGSTDFGGTLWINSTSSYTRNTGASVALGGRSYNTGSGNEHMTFARVSGVQTSGSDDKRGDYVVETAYDGKLYDRLRVKADGKVGLGVTEPSGGLHLLTDVVSTGIWNSGYRRDTPSSFLTPGTTTKVPNTAYSTILAPVGSSQGWLGRIDSSSSGFRYINGVVTNPGNGDVYVVGYFTGTINFFSDGSITSAGTTFTTGDQMGFVAKYRENGVFGWAARFDSSGINDWGFGIALVDTAGSSSNPSVFVTGSFATGGTFTAYAQGTSGAAYGTTLTNLGGGHDGFIVKYTSSGNVSGVAKINGIGDVVPTSAAGYGTTGFYIGGYYKLSSGNITAYNSVGGNNVFFGGPVGDYNYFLVKYDVDLNPLWITAIQGSSDQVIDYPTRGLTVNPANGDIYAVGYYDGSASFYNDGGGLGTSLTYPGTRAGFLVKYNTNGVVQWAAKITSNTSVVARGVGYSSAGYVYVTGDFLGTVTFRNSGDGGSTTTTQQDKLTSPGTTDRLIFITQYDTSGNNLWSTKIQSTGSTSPALVAKGMMIDADSNGNAYVAFHTEVSSGLSSSSVNIYQRGPASSAASSTYRHSLEGQGGFIGIVCYNSDGKVLYTSKVNSGDYDRVTSMDVCQKTTGDTYPRVILAGWTEGREISATDAVGDTFRFISGLSNSGNIPPSSTSNTSFIVQFPSSSTYVLDYPGTTEGVTKKFINPTANRAYLIPYYDVSYNVETAYTYKIIEVAPDTTLEIVYSGATYGWLASSNKPNFLVNYSGNIGIGTLLPNNLFQVDGTMAVVGNVGIGTKASTYQLLVYATSPNNSYASLIQQTNSSSGGLYVLCNTTSASQKALHIRTNAKDALVVNGDGSVGIGFTGSTTTILGTTTLGNTTVSGALTVTGGVTGAVPPGTINMYAAVTAPAGGWLLCNGQNVSRTTYAALFSIIGTTFGSGNGVDTFTLPNLKRRFPVGYDPSGGLNSIVPGYPNSNFNLLGSSGGAQTHTLTEAQMPAHTHSIAWPNGGWAGGGGLKDGNQGLMYEPKNTIVAGGSQAHNNMPPFIVVNFIIKT